MNNGQALATLITPPGSAFLARVSALNDDGTVSLAWGDEPVLSVPASTSYIGRAVDQVVIVQRIQGELIVTGTASSTEIDLQGLIDATVDPVSGGLDGAIDHLNTLDDFAHGVDDDVTRLENVRPRLTFGSGSAPAGFTAATAVYYQDQGNGRVDLYFQNASGGSVSAEQARPTKPATSKTTKGAKPVSISPTSRGSWRSGNGQTDSTVWQGDWTGRGDWTGGWFYGTAIAGACAGKSVKSMTFTIARTNDGSGWGRAVPAHLNLHAQASKGKPSGSATMHSVKLSPGQRVVYALPSAWVSELASGSSRGFMVSGSGRGDYLKLSQSSGSVRIVFN